MKISKYTKLYKYDDKFYIYNYISNFLCKINFQLYNTIKNGSIQNIKDEKILDILTKNKIFTQNEKDDILMYVSSIENKRRINNLLNLTIAPTMECNFSCSYCFETKTKGIMKDGIINNIIIFISNSVQLGVKHINITWFGGEPLLATSVIEKICKKLKAIDKEISIYQNIITNGYYLTDENLILLQECGIKSIQLSVDGVFDLHNKKRFTKLDNDTFTTIINNVDNYAKKKYEMYLCFRIGIDKDNINEYENINRFYKERYGDNKKITINPAFIIDTTKNKNKNSITCNTEKFNFKKYLAKELSDSTIIFPSNNISECAIRNYNSWCFDPKGDVYKCWEIIGNKKYKVGELTTSGINITNQIILNRYLFGSDHLRNDKCINCLNIVNCGGGCPHKRIENEFNNANFDLCSGFDDEFDNYILERIKIYENEN